MIINLQNTMFVEQGQRFTFRQMNKTVATGVVTKLLDLQTEDMKGYKARKKLMLAEAEKLGFNPYGEKLDEAIRKYEEKKSKANK